VVLVDLSQFCDAVETVVPLVSLDVGLDELTAVLEVFDLGEVGEGGLVDLNGLG